MVVFLDENTILDTKDVQSVEHFEKEFWIYLKSSVRTSGTDSIDLVVDDEDTANLAWLRIRAAMLYDFIEDSKWRNTYPLPVDMLKANGWADDVIEFYNKTY